jgi:hypothetical protein
MQADDWNTLIDQLERLPGGSARAEPDFFAAAITDGLAPTTSEWDYDGWLLRDGRVLSLRLDEAQAGLRLFLVDPEEAHFIARTGDALLDAARARNVSALVLFLLALATGQIDDNRRLKLHAPHIDAAAKDLMLMTVCRLCG